MYCEDAYCLGLLYAYIYAGKKMVLKDDLDKFHKIIEFNLKSIDNDTNDIYVTICYDNDPSIYFASEGKNGEIYYVLYPDFDLARAKSKYMGCLSTDVFVASQKENALDCLGLQLKDRHICKKQIKKIGVSGAPTFMNQFIQKLKTGELKIEKCSQLQVVPELTEDYIIKQLESYQNLLNSEVFENITKNEQGPILKKTRSIN